MEKGLQSAAVSYFFDAVLSLENREECYKFFEDVCTVKELVAIAQRVEVAKMLREERTYLDIAKETGASTATISRVSRCINYGAGGYKIILSRLEDK